MMYVIVDRVQKKRDKVKLFDIDTGVVKNVLISELCKYGIKCNTDGFFKVYSPRELIELMNKNSAEKGVGGCFKVSYLNNKTILLKSAVAVSRATEKIIVPYGITSIEEKAFCKATNSFVKEIVLPATVERVGCYAFAEMPLLERVYLTSVKVIGHDAFLRCYRLKTVFLGDSLCCIKESAFRDCRSLQSIKTPVSLTQIEARAFSDCSSLKRVKIFDGCQSIGFAAFDNCSSLEEVWLPNTLEDFEFSEDNGLRQLMAIAEKGGAFAGCPKLKYISMPCTLLAKWCKYCVVDKLIPKSVEFLDIKPAKQKTCNNFIVTLQDDVPYSLKEIRVPAEVFVNVCSHKVKVVTIKR